jgi:hypothetical protein
LEKAVNAPLVDPVVKALTDAMAPGEEHIPASLLVVLQADSDPTSTLDDIDRGNAHFAAIQAEFAFLHISRVTRKSPASEEQKRLAALMRWLIREFNTWNQANDPQRHMLAALFVVTAYCNQSGSFWPAFAPHVTNNPGLAEHLGKRVAGFRTAPAASELSRTPISDGEVIGRFNRADSSGDWATVAADWPRLGDHVFPDAFISQAVRYLHEFSRDTLRLAANQIRQMVPVMLVLLSLTVAESFSLSLVSTNPYVQFGAVLRFLKQQRRDRQNVCKRLPLAA